MARSHKHTPFLGWTSARSEKEFKRWYNRLYRRCIKSLKPDWDDDSKTLPVLKELVNLWDGPKDGKGWHDNGFNHRNLKIQKRPGRHHWKKRTDVKTRDGIGFFDDDYYDKYYRK